MKTSQALTPKIIAQSQHGLVLEAINLLTGVLLLTGLAQLKFFLPSSLVPVTGQTFGVLILALNWGQSRATLCVALYLLAGMAGFPVFATGTAGLYSFGPTSGYLVGMLAATLVVGWLADRGWSRSWLLCLLSVAIGHLLIYLFGLAVLQSFIGSDQLLNQGFYPFIPGMLFKSAAAILITVNANRMI